MKESIMEVFYQFIISSLEEGSQLRDAGNSRLIQDCNSCIQVKTKESKH